MSKKKKIIIILVVSILIIGSAVGLVAVLKKSNKNKKVVDVYPVSELLGETDWYEYEDTLYGYVDTSMQQNIYLSSSQQIEEIKVKEGQEVKAGDVILVYDTTAQELELAQMRADVEIARADVVVAERELENLKNTTPVEEVPEEPTTEAVTPEEPTTEDGVATSTDATTEEEITTEEIPETEEILEPEEETYTKEELDKAIKDKENEIKSLKIAYQLAQIDLELMEYQNSNGEVLANFDGVVTTVMDEEEAILNSKPVIVISGESGCTVKASIGELSLGDVHIGDSVELYCYEDGMMYTGTITEISTTPETDQYYYGSSVESYYPMTITVLDGEDLRQGMGMDVTVISDDSLDVAYGDEFYLPLAFVANENGKYYVMKDNNGVLEKTYVQTGKILWGDTIKILGGVGRNDLIAFPYASDAKEGVKTKEASTSSMYYY